MRPLKSLVVAAIVVSVAACTDAAGEATSTPTTAPSATTASATQAPSTTSSPLPSTSVTVAIPPLLPPLLEEWGAGYVELDGRELFVAIADTPEKRRQGLMEVDDLLDLDGMLFVFDSDTSGGFWMKNTVLPLDIAFFDAQGRLVDGFVMEPCTADPCPTYLPGGNYRFALEMEAGTMPQNPTQLETGVR